MTTAQHEDPTAHAAAAKAKSATGVLGRDALVAAFAAATVPYTQVGTVNAAVTVKVADAYAAPLAALAPDACCDGEIALAWRFADGMAASAFRSLDWLNGVIASMLGVDSVGLRYGANFYSTAPTQAIDPAKLEELLGYVATVEAAVSDAHRKHLASSGLTDVTIDAAGIFTVEDEDEARYLVNWKGSRSSTLAPAIAFPYFDSKGHRIQVSWVSRDYRLTRLRPDRPRLRDGKSVKYEQPSNAGVRLYFPPTIKPATWRDATTTVWITEGEKKALCAAQEGVACVSVPGVWNFHNAALRRVDKEWHPHPDLVSLGIKDRRFVIAYDADVVTKKTVHDAELRLASVLLDYGAAEVKLARLPMATKGLDDYLVSSSDKRGALVQLEAAAKPVTASQVETVKLTPGIRRLKAMLDAPRAHAVELDTVAMADWLGRQFASLETCGPQLLAVEASTGAGKSHAIAAFAAQWYPTKKGDQRLVIAVDRYETRDQIVKWIPPGVPVLMPTGILRRTLPNGKPACARYDEAKQVMEQRNVPPGVALCPKCIHRSGCPAREPDGHAGGVVITVHQLARKHARVDDLVVMDEVPELVDHRYVEPGTVENFGTGDEVSRAEEKLISEAAADETRTWTFHEEGDTVSRLSQAGKLLATHPRIALTSATLPPEAMLHRLRDAGRGGVRIERARLLPLVPQPKVELRYSGELSRKKLLPRRLDRKSGGRRPRVHEDNVPALFEDINLAIDGYAASGGTKPVLVVLFKSLAETAEDMGVFASAPVEVRLGWHGGLKGSNAHEGIGLLIAASAQFANMTMASAEAKVLGVEPADYLVHCTRADLEQTIGRPRNSRRTDPARIIVLGPVAPLHVRAVEVDLHLKERGRPVSPKVSAAMVQAQVAKLGGPAETCRVMKLVLCTLKRWRKSGAPGDAWAEAMRNTVREGVVNSPQEREPSYGEFPTPSPVDLHAYRLQQGARAGRANDLETSFAQALFPKLGEENECVIVQATGTSSGRCHVTGIYEYTEDLAVLLAGMTRD